MIPRRLVLVTALLLAAGGAGPARAADPVGGALAPIVLPPGNDVQLAVGGGRRFSATVTAQNVEYRWTVDGRRVGTGRSFDYEPASGDIGVHEIAVTVLQGPAATRHVWRVTVAPPPVPTIVDVAPGTAVVRAQPGSQVTFRYLVQSSIPTDTVEVVWTVDGTRAGVGSSLTLDVADRGARRVRAVASSGLGVVQAREWRLVAAGQTPGPPTTAPGEVEPDPELVALLRTMKPEKPARSTPPPTARGRPTTTVVRAPPATTVARARPTTTVVRAPPATTTTAASRTPRARPTTTIAVARATPPTTMPLPARPRPSPPARPAPPAPKPERTPTVVAAVAPPPEPPPPPPGIPREEVVAFLERYARAYETRSVGELERLGQITSAEQAEALGRYFDQVRDLRVDVQLLRVEPRGDGVAVRYRRRDRFRDPTGREVDKETPPIEKEIRRTPRGLVFSPSS